MRDVSVLALLFVVVLLCESAWQSVLAEHGANGAATTDGMQRRLMSTYVTKCVKKLQSDCGTRCKKFPDSKCLRTTLVDCDYGNMVRETFRRRVRTKYRKVCGSNSTNGGGGGGGKNSTNSTNKTRF